MFFFLSTSILSLAKIIKLVLYKSIMSYKRNQKGNTNLKFSSNKIIVCGGWGK